MDHFFSAVEERERPELKGKPVVVGADPKEGKGRGVVKTCNYEARKFMIQSGMSISKAWRFCPNAVFVRANYKLYKVVSAEIMRILRKYSGKFQQWGIDEAFLDVSFNVRSFEEALKLAVSIKHEILWSEDLTCSIGIAPNKLVAKIASDFRKPDGLTVVTEDAVKEFLAPLPVRKMLWIGKKTEGKLNRMDIRTIGDIAAFNVSSLVERFGVMGRRYYQWACGIHDSEVGRRRRTRKSLGHESTFTTNTDNYDMVLKRLEDLCQKVQDRILRHILVFRAVTVKIRYEDFQTFTRRKTLPFFTNRLQDLQKVVLELAQEYVRAQGSKKIRLLGVRVSNLKSGKGQKTLNG